MSNPEKKPIIGILGGIGSGKSTVAAQFGKLGCKTIDADKIAHELLDEPNVRERVVALFGHSILGLAGEIDRKKLADTVFTDVEKLALLNSIIHPPVLSRIEQLIERYSRELSVKAIVLDMPLLLEVGWEKRCTKLIFVDCRSEIRVKRARKMGIFNEKQLKIRENFQISLDNKANIAENTIDNNSGFSALVKQVAKIFTSVIGNG